MKHTLKKILLLLFSFHWLTSIEQYFSFQITGIHILTLQVLLLLLLLSCFSRVRRCATPQTAAHQAPPSLGFSRQEQYSGLPFPSPMNESEKWNWSCSVVSDSQRPHGLQPTRLPRPWDSPGKNTGVGCHFLLQCESEKWKWSRSVMSDPQQPHGLQPTGLLHPWDFPGKSTGVGCHCLLRCKS